MNRILGRYAPLMLLAPVLSTTGCKNEPPRTTIVYHCMKEVDQTRYAAVVDQDGVTGKAAVYGLEHKASYSSYKNFSSTPTLPPARAKEIAIRFCQSDTTSPELN